MAITKYIYTDRLLHSSALNPLLFSVIFALEGCERKPTIYSHSFSQRSAAGTSVLKEIKTAVDSLYQVNDLIKNGMIPHDAYKRVVKSPLATGFHFDKNLHDNYYALTFDGFGTVASGLSPKMSDMKFTIVETADKNTSKNDAELVGVTFTLNPTQKLEEGKCMILDIVGDSDIKKIRTSPLINIEYLNPTTLRIETTNASYYTTITPLENEKFYYIDGIKVEKVSLEKEKEAELEL